MGYVLREVFTPPEILHFKTDCSLLASDEILTTKRLQASGCFDGYKVINVADGEEAAANAIRFNDYVIMPKGFPKTKAILEDHGYIVKEINNSECAKLDGGMSCLSLRLNLL
jgi:dimethylargininase